MTDLMVTIDFFPKNQPLRYFFGGVQMLNFPRLLNSIGAGNNYYESPVSLRFYRHLDWEDLQDLSAIGGIKEGEVAIYHEVYGETTIKESLFIHIVVEFSRKLVDVYRNDSTLPVDWLAQMNAEIGTLGNKIGS